MSRNKKRAEQIVREFLDSLTGWDKPKLCITEVTNNSANDYDRRLTHDETEQMIADFLKTIDDT